MEELLVCKEGGLVVGVSGAKQGGGVWGTQPPPPEFWKGGLNTCQPP